MNMPVSLAYAETSLQCVESKLDNEERSKRVMVYHTMKQP